MQYRVKTRNRQGDQESYDFAKRINAFRFAYRTAEMRDITHVYLCEKGVEGVHRIKEPELIGASIGIRTQT